MATPIADDGPSIRQRMEQLRTEDAVAATLAAQVEEGGLTPFGARDLWAKRVRELDAPQGATLTFDEAVAAWRIVPVPTPEQAALDAYWAAKTREEERAALQQMAALGMGMVD